MTLKGLLFVLLSIACLSSAQTDWAINLDFGTFASQAYVDAGTLKSLGGESTIQLSFVIKQTSLAYNPLIEMGTKSTASFFSVYVDATTKIYVQSGTAAAQVAAKLSNGMAKGQQRHQVREIAPLCLCLVGDPAECAANAGAVVVQHCAVARALQGPVCGCRVPWLSAWLGTHRLMSGPSAQLRL